MVCARNLGRSENATQAPRSTTGGRGWLAHQGWLAPGAVSLTTKTRYRVGGGEAQGASTSRFRGPRRRGRCRNPSGSAASGLDLEAVAHLEPTQPTPELEEEEVEPICYNQPRSGEPSAPKTVWVQGCRTLARPKLDSGPALRVGKRRSESCEPSPPRLQPVRKPGPTPEAAKPKSRPRPALRVNLRVPWAVKAAPPWESRRRTLPPR